MLKSEYNTCPRGCSTNVTACPCGKRKLKCDYMSVGDLVRDNVRTKPFKDDDIEKKDVWIIISMKQTDGSPVLRIKNMRTNDIVDSFVSCSDLVMDGNDIRWYDD